MTQNAGYTKPLFILPFDHRSSFTKDMFGIVGRALTTQEQEQVKEVKQIIYDGFKQAVKSTMPKEAAAILTDETFGSNILVDAKKQGFITILPIEKSGQKVFDFENGVLFAKSIVAYSPSFVKVLVRYNIKDNIADKILQQERLKQVSDFTHKEGYKFLFELLVPPTTEQLESVGNDKNRYDKELRPKITKEVIVQLQQAGIEPDIWKLEGMDTKEAYVEIAQQVQVDGRDNVGIVILGRGEAKDGVEHWISEGASVEGVIGFAVGRTIFWQPLQDYRAGKKTKSQASNEISQNFIHFYQLFKNKKGEMIDI